MSIGNSLADLLKLPAFDAPEKLAVAVGCSVGTLGRWRSGKSVPSGNKLQDVMILCKKNNIECHLDALIQNSGIDSDVLSNIDLRLSKLEERPMEIKSFDEDRILQLEKIINEQSVTIDKMEESFSELKKLMERLKIEQAMTDKEIQELQRKII